MSAGVVAAVLVLLAAAVARAARHRVTASAVMSRLDGVADPRPHRLLDTLPSAPPWFARALSDAALDGVSPDRAYAAAVAATAALACVAALVAGPVMGVVGPVVVVAAGVGARPFASGRGDRRYEVSLPLALDLIARSLRSGASLHQAIDEASRGADRRVARDLSRVVEATRLGSPVVAALDGWAAARPLPGVRLAAAALCLGAEAGGAQARAIDGVAATLRERAGVAAEVRALTSQARTSAVVIAAAPVAFCAVTTATDARNAQFLFRTPLGVGLLLAGLALDGAAVRWMHALTRRVAG